MVYFIILVVFAYLLGAVPFGFLIAKAHGKDLRKIGSGNIGATNTVRALGKKRGVLCFILDVLKGLIPMLLVPIIGIIDEQPGPGQLALWLMVGCAAVLGHIFPIYLKFKGGKGAATSLGIVLGLWPYYTLCGVLAFTIWATTLQIWRYVSLSSILAALFFPVLLSVFILFIDAWQFSQLWPLILVAVLMALLIIVRHKTNITRLLEGTETKIGQKKEQ